MLIWVSLAQDAFTPEVERRNEIRDAIRNFFPKRDCFTMVSVAVLIGALVC